VKTNISQTTHTDGRGSFSLRALSASTYKMPTTSKGFGTVEQDNIILTVNQQAMLNVMLEPAASTSVTVHAIPVLPDSDDATLGTDVSSKYSVQIPLADRDPHRADILAGGVTETTGSGTQDSYPEGTNVVSNGQRNATAEIQLDGNLTSVPEQGEGGTTNVYHEPSVEALQEFKVEKQQLFRRVWEQWRHGSEYGDQVWQQSASRQLVLVWAESDIRRARLFQVRSRSRLSAKTLHSGS
jgi:hypothetical protein